MYKITFVLFVEDEGTKSEMLGIAEYELMRLKERIVSNKHTIDIPISFHQVQNLDVNGHLSGE